MAPPRCWLLLGTKPGDNSQALRLAEASALPFERKRIVLKPGYDLAKPRVKASLHHVDLQASDALAPPWPDLVLTIGRRLTMVALWIKDQSPATRLALIGPPKRKAGRFDLIVAPSHYRIADAPNVCRIGLPLLGADPARIAADGVRLASRVAGLKRPLTVFLTGGPLGTHSFDPVLARDMVARIDRQRDGGSVFVTTSRRTPDATAEAIAKALCPTDRFHRWRPDDADNPYFALLAHGDRFVVTGDSVSMVIEVARLAKPLAIAPLRPANRSLANALAALKVPGPILWPMAGGAAALLARTPFGSGAATRDFALLHALMFARGWAVPLGAPFVTSPEPPPDDTAIAAARLRDLVGASG